jgi:capsular polysaccharide biosynthesis protein
MGGTRPCYTMRLAMPQDAPRLAIRNLLLPSEFAMQFTGNVF